MNRPRLNGRIDSYLPLPYPCCDHCGCGTLTGYWRERLGHDDTCRFGCNDPCNDASRDPSRVAVEAIQDAGYTLKPAGQVEHLAAAVEALSSAIGRIIGPDVCLSGRALADWERGRRHVEAAMNPARSSKEES